jgi:hypothetical protein
MSLGDYVIPDDSGILAVVDASRYRPFIGPEWTLDAILERFRESMRERCLIAWSPGCEGNWRVVAESGPPEPGANRLVEGSIRVTRDGLHLVSYDSLTRAAQFPNVSIPEPHERDNLIRLPPGLYTCSVAQLFPPEENHSEAVFNQQTPHFRLSFVPSGESLLPWPGVRWLDLG